MLHPSLEVADIFRDHGPAWRDANRGRVSLHQLKVMSAIESCRTAALGGHVARSENESCGHTVIAYNSCRNRHCPKCQGAAAGEWMEARASELLPVPYLHVVFTLSSAIADIAYQYKAVIYDLLFKVSAETKTTVAADPMHLGARIAITSVLHTSGSITLRVKNYRREGTARYKTMTLEPQEFIRRFLLHLLPNGFHRTRRYGLLASGVKAENLARMRRLLDVAPTIEPEITTGRDPDVLPAPFPCCGSAMRIIEFFEAGSQPRDVAIPPDRIDTS